MFADFTAFYVRTTALVWTGNDNVRTFFYMSGGDVTVLSLLVTQWTGVVSLWALGFKVAFDVTMEQLCRAFVWA